VISAGLFPRSIPTVKTQLASLNQRAPPSSSLPELGERVRLGVAPQLDRTASRLQVDHADVPQDLGKG